MAFSIWLRAACNRATVQPSVKLSASSQRAIVWKSSLVFHIATASENVGAPWCTCITWSLRSSTVCSRFSALSFTECTDVFAKSVQSGYLSYAPSISLACFCAAMLSSMSFWVRAWVALAKLDRTSWALQSPGDLMRLVHGMV